MNEKIFKTMGRAGSANIAVGIIVTVVGIASGVLTIVGGVKLLKDRRKLTF